LLDDPTAEVGIDQTQDGLGTRVQPLAPLGVEAIAAHHIADDVLSKLR